MVSALRVVAWFTWLRVFHWFRQFAVLSKEQPKHALLAQHIDRI